MNLLADEGEKRAWSALSYGASPTESISAAGCVPGLRFEPLHTTKHLQQRRIAGTQQYNGLVNRDFKIATIKQIQLRESKRVCVQSLPSSQAPAGLGAAQRGRSTRCGVCCRMPFS